MELSHRQLVASRRLFVKGGGAVWWRVGTGKTRIAYQYFVMVTKACKHINPKFIVVCRREAFFDWKEELKKCGLNWRVREVETEDDFYAGPKTSRPTVYLISHGMLSKLADVISEASALVEAIAYDEGFLYKNPSTKHCKAANRISAAIGQAIILSGSVMTARDLTDIYGQLFAINRHQTLARTLTDFRSKFLYRFKINPNANSQAAVWRAARGAGNRIAKGIRPISTLYFPANNARRIVTDIRTIPASGAQLNAFRSLKEWYELELRGRIIELKNAPSVIIKCQQISDGFAYLGDETICVESGKMDYLMARVSELLTYQERLVVWCAFRKSVNLILQRLQTSFPSVECYGMSGGIPFDTSGWKKNGQIAVATVASGSSVNHFKDCAYAIYYSHSFHWLHMQQSLGRTNRNDSRHSTCYYYYLQTQGSLDAFVYKKVFSSQQEETKLIQQAVNSWLSDAQ